MSIGWKLPLNLFSWKVWMDCDQNYIGMSNGQAELRPKLLRTYVQIMHGISFVFYDTFFNIYYYFSYLASATGFMYLCCLKIHSRYSESFSRFRSWNYWECYRNYEWTGGWRDVPLITVNSFLKFYKNLLKIWVKLLNKKFDALVVPWLLENVMESGSLKPPKPFLGLGPEIIRNIWVKKQNRCLNPCRSSYSVAVSYSVPPQTDG